MIRWTFKLTRRDSFNNLARRKIYKWTLSEILLPNERGSYFVPEDTLHDKIDVLLLY